MSTASNFLDQYLEPVVEAFTPAVAQKFLEMTPGEKVLARVQELGDKSNDGTLTDEEWSEYQHYVDVGNMIGLLKAKARRYLSNEAG